MSRSITLSRAAAARRPHPQPLPSPQGFDSDFWVQLLQPEASNRVSVSEQSVIGLPAVGAGVDMVAHAVAQMMTEANVYDANGSQLPTPPIVERPNVLMGSFEWWYGLVAQAMMRGNDVSILADYDDDGRPRQAVPIGWDLVHLNDTSGLPVYEIGDADYRYDEVVHVRHAAPRGSFVGRGVVERYRLAMSGMLHEQKYGERSFSTGGIPSAVVTLDTDKVEPEVAQTVKSDFVDRFGNGRREPAVVPRTMSITPISWSPEDAEFVEARKMSIGEAALVCNLHPADLGASLGGTLDYANITERQLARILQAFTPWMTLCEQAWSDLLPEGQFVKGSVEALLRSSTKERFEVYEIGHRLGIYSTPELREMERRPPLPVEPEQQQTTEEEVANV